MVYSETTRNSLKIIKLFATSNGLFHRFKQYSGFHDVKVNSLTMGADTEAIKTFK